MNTFEVKTGSYIVVSDKLLFKEIADVHNGNTYIFCPVYADSALFDESERMTTKK